MFQSDCLMQKVAVVTGGTGMLGSHYCQALAASGAKVIIADLHQEACEALAKRIHLSHPSSPEPVGLAVDLAEEDHIRAWAQRIHEIVPAGADIIVNNAAVKSPNFFEPLESYSLVDWNFVMNVNVTAMFLVVRELGPSMAAKGKGSIINISSIYGLVGPDQRIYEGSWYEELGGPINTPLIYSVSKGAVIAMTRYLATYWGHKGIRTNAITPGGVASGQNTSFTERYSAKVPLGRMAHANELIGALLFLASDASSYVNGHNLIVDGGWTAW